MKAKAKFHLSVKRFPQLFAIGQVSGFFKKRIATGSSRAVLFVTEWNPNFVTCTGNCRSDFNQINFLAPKKKNSRQSFPRVLCLEIIDFSLRYVSNISGIEIDII